MMMMMMMMMMKKLLLLLMMMIMMTLLMKGRFCQPASSPNLPFLVYPFTPCDSVSVLRGVRFNLFLLQLHLRLPIPAKHTNTDLIEE